MATRSTEETISEIENPWFRLGAAMLHYAILDARRGDPQAKAWLLSVDCRDLRAMLGVSFGPESWKQYVLSGCKKKG